jgi:hypothetical protein
MPEQCDGCTIFFKISDENLFSVLAKIHLQVPKMTSDRYQNLYEWIYDVTLVLTPPWLIRLQVTFAIHFKLKKNIVRTNFRREWAKLYKISFMAEILIKKSKYLFHSLLDENVSFFVSENFIMNEIRCSKMLVKSKKRSSVLGAFQF